MKLDTRPNGLHTPATPATIPDPCSPSAQRADAQQQAARAAERIDYVPVLTERERADARLAVELQREAANRGRKLRALAP